MPDLDLARLRALVEKIPVHGVGLTNDDLCAVLDALPALLDAAEERDALASNYATKAACYDIALRLWRKSETKPKPNAMHMRVT